MLLSEVKTFHLGSQVLSSFPRPYIVFVRIGKLPVVSGNIFDCSVCDQLYLFLTAPL